MDYEAYRRERMDEATREELETLRRRVRDLQKAIQELQSDKPETRANLGREMMKAANAEDKAAKIQLQYYKVDDERSRLQEEVERLQDENDDLEDEVERLQDENEQLRAELEKCRKSGGTMDGDHAGESQISGDLPAPVKPKRGRPVSVPESVKEQARRMRAAGYSFRSIASGLHISVGTAHSLCQGVETPEG